MADVSEPRATGREFANEGERLVNRGMHGMRSVAKGVQNEMVEVAEQYLRGVRDGTEVGEIGNGTDTETMNGERAVLSGDGNDARAEEFKVFLEMRKRRSATFVWH